MTFEAFWIAMGGDVVPLGEVAADNLDAALFQARERVGGLGGGAVHLQRLGVEPPSRERRERLMFEARLWRSSETRRVTQHVARRRKRRRISAALGE